MHGRIIDPRPTDGKWWEAQRSSPGTPPFTGDAATPSIEAVPCRIIEGPPILSGSTSDHRFLQLARGDSGARNEGRGHPATSSGVIASGGAWGHLGFAYSATTATRPDHPPGRREGPSRARTTSR